MVGVSFSIPHGRVEFDPDHYPRIVVWDSKNQVERVLYLHRCVEYAHGDLECLWDDDHVHHLDCDGWNNRPENLEAMTQDLHADYEPHVGNLQY